MRAVAVADNRPGTGVSTAHGLAAMFVVECDRDMPVISIPRPEPQVVVRFGRFALNGLDLHALGAGGKVHRKGDGRGNRAVVARLQLGTAEAVLGVPASTLATRIVPLEMLWGPAAAQRLADRLHRAPDTVNAAAIVEGAIAERLLAARGHNSRAQFALTAAARLSRASVSAVAADLNVSERHLRRVFHETVGMSPKAFARLARFDRALRAARRHAHETWASIAAAAGYYDQAHLIAEFRAIAGASPRAFLSELRGALSVG